MAWCSGEEHSFSVPEGGSPSFCRDGFQELRAGISVKAVSGALSPTESHAPAPGSTTPLAQTTHTFSSPDPRPVQRGKGGFLASLYRSGNRGSGRPGRLPKNTQLVLALPPFPSLCAVAGTMTFVELIASDVGWESQLDSQGRIPTVRCVGHSRCSITTFKNTVLPGAPG